MVQWGLRFDMRAPAFEPTPLPDRYRAALDLCRWADGLGAHDIVLSEHHGSDDGYLPSPLIMAAGIAAVTLEARVVIAALILPLLDPVRAAEDTLIVDQISGGRVAVVVGLGYVPREFQMFGLDVRRRVALLEEKLPVFTAALTGQDFQYRGQTLRVTPPPVQKPRPPVLVGGGVASAARRAARLGDGFLPMLSDPAIFEAYLSECRRLDKPPLLIRPSGPLFIHVAEDPERSWAQIAPHAMHEMNAYGRWAAESGTDTGYRPIEDVAALRATGMYRVVTPQECVELARGLDEGSSLSFHPLMGGLPPELGWESLELFAAKVLPQLHGEGG